MSKLGAGGRFDIFLDSVAADARLNDKRCLTSMGSKWTLVNSNSTLGSH